MNLHVSPWVMFLVTIVFCFCQPQVSKASCSETLYGCSIIIQAPSYIEAMPGQTLTLGFVVTNVSEVQLNLEESVFLPPEWRLLIDIPGFSLDPGGSDLRLVVVSIPQDCPWGDYVVSYVVSDSSNSNSCGCMYVSVSVSALPSLAILTIEAPPYVLAGEEYSVVYNLMNLGNLRADIEVRAGVNEAVPAVVSPSELTLDPGESKQVIAEVITDGKRPQVYTSVLRLTVTATYPTGHVSDHECISRIEVIPLGGSEVREYNLGRFEFASIASHDPKRSALTLELSGSGPLTEDKGVNLDFILRTKQIATAVDQISDDQWQFKLTGEHGQFRVGDGYFALSALTEAGVRGCGVEGSMEVVIGRIGGYWIIAQASGAEERALYLNADLKNNEGAKVTYLRKTIPLSGGVVNDRICSVESRAMCYGDIELGGGFGLSLRERQGDEDELGTSCHLQVSGSAQNLQYSVGILAADHNYCGPVRDAAQFNLFLATTPVPRLSVWGLIYGQHTGAGDLSRTVAAGLAWNINEKSSVALSSRSTSKCEAEGMLEKFGTFTNLSFAHTEEKTRLDGYLQLIREQETCGKTNEAKKLGISLSCVLSPNKVYKAYYRTDMGQISKRFIGASASYSLPNSQKILADLSLERAATGKASIYRIDIGYSACFDIPFSIKRDKEVVKGVVRRSEDHGYLGVPNVLVRMDGMFVLSGVAPGVHYIDIDRSSIPSNLIPAVQLPLRVDVLAGTEVELVIDLTQSGSIAGTVTRLGPEEEIVLLPGGHEKVIGERVGIYGVIIELRGELETLRSKTGPQGEFQFTALRPGTWVISIPQFGDDVERIVVTIEPGEEAIVNIVIPPKLREATLLENIEIPVQ